jgi:cation transport ATPase
MKTFLERVQSFIGWKPAGTEAEVQPAVVPNGPQDTTTVIWWEKLPGASRNADAIRDAKVAAERHRVEVDLAKLRTERRYLDESESSLQQEIKSSGRTEADGKHKRRRGMISLVLFIFALLLTMGAVLWGSQIMELSPWKQSILLSAVVLSVAGFEGFFRNLRRLVERPEFRKWMLNISVVTVLCGLFGAGSLAVSRGLATRMEAKQSTIVGFSDSDKRP